MNKFTKDWIRTMESDDDTYKDEKVANPSTILQCKQNWDYLSYLIY